MFRVWVFLVLFLLQVRSRIKQNKKDCNCYYFKILNHILWNIDKYMRAECIRSRLLKDKNPPQLQITGSCLGKTACKALYKIIDSSGANRCE